jgi:cytochrome c-type biogenesis protein CcmE
MTRGRGRYIVAVVICAAVVIFMLFVLQKNVVYLKTVSQAVAQRDKQGARDFRMGGSVVPGTIASRQGGGADFELTEGGVVAKVAYSGSPPDLFKDCAPVVVEGHWSGKTFVSDRLLIKHGNEYEPPKDDKKNTKSACA